MRIVGQTVSRSCACLNHLLGYPSHRRLRSAMDDQSLGRRPASFAGLTSSPTPSPSPPSRPSPALHPPTLLSPLIRDVVQTLVSSSRQAVTDALLSLDSADGEQIIPIIHAPSPHAPPLSTLDVATLAHGLQVRCSASCLYEQLFWEVAPLLASTHTARPLGLDECFSCAIRCVGALPAEAHESLSQICVSENCQSPLCRGSSL